MSWTGVSRIRIQNLPEVYSNPERLKYLAQVRGESTSDIEPSYNPGPFLRRVTTFVNLSKNGRKDVKDLVEKIKISGLNKTTLKRVLRGGETQLLSPEQIIEVLRSEDFQNLYSEYIHKNE